MIEIIKPVANEEKHEIVCNECKSLLRYEDDDLEMVGYEQGIFCPNCDEFIVLKKYPPFQFPISFYHFEGNGNKLSNEETQKFIDNSVKYVKESKEDWDMGLTGTGDTLVITIKNNDGITCYVAKDYYEATEFYDY